MSWRTISVLILLIGVSIFHLSCSSPYTKENHPFFDETTLDRGSFLPANISAYRILGIGSTEQLDESYVYPLYWEQGFSERLTFVWMPLPLQVKYLLYENDQKDSVSIEGALLGSMYSRKYDFHWRPQISATGRKRINTSLALESEFNAQWEINRVSENRVARTFGFRLGVAAQLTRWFYLKGSTWAWNEVGEVRAKYIGAVPPSYYGPSAQNSRWRFPLQADVTIRLGRQWDFSTSVLWFRIGYESDFSSIPIFLTLSHYW